MTAKDILRQVGAGLPSSKKGQHQRKTRRVARERGGLLQTESLMTMRGQTDALGREKFGSPEIR